MWTTTKRSRNKISPKPFFRQNSLYESYHWDEPNSFGKQNRKFKSEPWKEASSISTRSIDSPSDVTVRLNKNGQSLPQYGSESGVAGHLDKNRQSKHPNNSINGAVVHSNENVQSLPPYDSESGAGGQLAEKSQIRHPFNSTNVVVGQIDGDRQIKHPYNLSKVIRKRKYEGQTAQVGTFLNNSGSGFSWTPPLSQRMANKQKGQPEEDGQNKEWEFIKERFREVGHSIELWGSWFKMIEGHQGTGVVSYFVFLKWLLFLNIYLFFIVLIFIVIPPSIIPVENGYATAVTSTGLSTVSTTNADTCSAGYKSSVTYSTAEGDVIQDFFQGTGWMEYTALFYGWYPAKLLKELDYRIPIAYLMATLGLFFFSLVRLAISCAAYLRQNLITNRVQIDCFFKVFVGWDYTLSDEKTCKLKRKGIYTDLIAHLDYQRYILNSEGRDGCARFGLYALRVFVNFIIFCILGGCGFVIYWVNDRATNYLNTESSNGGVVVFFVQFLPSVTITVLNVIVPLLFGLFIKLENYTEYFVIIITLFRTVFLRLASLAVLMASLLVTVRCSDKESTCNVGQGDCIPIRCWETYIGQALYKLMVTDFFVHILIIFGYQLPRKLWTTCFGKVCSKIGPAEFDIPSCVLDLIYTQALCWLGCLYCPLITGMAVVNLLTLFYLKLFSALYTTVPPKKPYKASRTNIFFTIVLIITFVLCCSTVVYTMVDMRPSAGCGPFRIYSDMSIPVDVCIANSPSRFQTFVDVITARSLVVALLIILCVIIYCLFVWGYGNHSTAKKIKQELYLERQDKHYLLGKFSGRIGTDPKRKSRQGPKNLHNGYADGDDDATEKNRIFDEAALICIKV